MSRGFSSQLRVEADGIWRRIAANPFLAELRKGTLPLEKFRYYLAQDYLYLEGFARTVAMALAKAPDARNVDLLSRRVVTPVERPMHRELMPLAGMSLRDLDSKSPSPTNLAYVNHMLSTASLGGLGVTAAALLPCPWTYHEIGSTLGPIDHPVYSRWAEPYKSGFLGESTAAWRTFLDEEAAQAGSREKEAMRRAFMTSIRYEYLFWDMAYRQERWPL